MNIDLSTVGEFTINVYSIDKNIMSISVTDISNSIVHYKDCENFEFWDNGQVRHTMTGNISKWYTFDCNRNMVYYTDSNGNKNWYNSIGNEISEGEYYCNKAWGPMSDYAKRQPPIPLT